jgi:hypothetical protein
MNCFYGYADVTGDGVSDHVCYCQNQGDDSENAICPLDDSNDLYSSSSNCAHNMAEYWEYTDVTAQCSSNYDDMSDYADACCTSQTSICESGYCVSSDSTVSTLVIDEQSRSLRSTNNNDNVVNIPLSDLKVGDKILALKHNDDKHTSIFTEVEKITKSPSTGHFYELEMTKENKDLATKIRATPHHTFPSCNHNKDKLIKALDMKEGDCLFNGKGEKTFIQKINKQEVSNDDQTYSIQVKGSNVIIVGDVATTSVTSNTLKKLDAIAANRQGNHFHDLIHKKEDKTKFQKAFKNTKHKDAINVENKNSKQSFMNDVVNKKKSLTEKDKEMAIKLINKQKK